MKNIVYLLLFFNSYILGVTAQQTNSQTTGTTISGSSTSTSSGTDKTKPTTTGTTGTGVNKGTYEPATGTMNSGTMNSGTAIGNYPTNAEYYKSVEELSKANAYIMQQKLKERELLNKINEQDKYIKDLTVELKDQKEKTIETSLNVSPSHNLYNNDFFDIDKINTSSYKDSSYLAIKSYPSYVESYKNNPSLVGFSRKVNELLNRIDVFNSLVNNTNNLISNNKIKDLELSNVLLHSYIEHAKLLKIDSLKQLNSSYIKKMNNWNVDNYCYFFKDSLNEDIKKLTVKQRTETTKQIQRIFDHKNTNTFSVNVGDLFSVDSIVSVKSKAIVRLKVKNRPIDLINISSSDSSISYPLIWKILSYSQIDKRNSLFRILLKYSFILRKPIEDVLIDITSGDRLNRLIISWDDALISTIMPCSNDLLYAGNNSIVVAKVYSMPNSFSSMSVPHYKNIIKKFLTERYSQVPEENKNYITDNQVLLYCVNGMVSKKSNVWENLEIFLYASDENKLLKTEVTLDGRCKQLADLYITKPNPDVIDGGIKIEKRYLNQLQGFGNKLSDDFNLYFSSRPK